MPGPPNLDLYSAQPSRTGAAGCPVAPLALWLGLLLLFVVAEPDVPEPVRRRIYVDLQYQRTAGLIERQVIRRRCTVDRQLHGGSSGICRVCCVRSGERDPRIQSNLAFIVVSQSRNLRRTVGGYFSEKAVIGIGC